MDFLKNSNSKNHLKNILYVNTIIFIFINLIYVIIFLFEKDIKITIDDCKKVYDDWDDMDKEVKRICCNMMFNLGLPRYKKFKLMIKAIKERNHEEAAKQMKQSRWYNQVTNRAERLIERMKKVGKL